MKNPLTATTVAAFAATYLSPRFDGPRPSPPFHAEGWELYCSDTPQCAIAAPRNHAKSTAFTHVFILATCLFRCDRYVVLVGNSEEMAIEHLHDISAELHENDELRKDFGIDEFETDQKTDIVVRMEDGHRFRIIARGASQAIRGKKWNGGRPSLIIFDDIEDDEAVANPDTRRKFKQWFFRALKQALRDGGRIRGHGTILHEDSMLNSLMKNKQWQTRLWKAHEGFDDFTNILWETKFPEARLRLIRQEFIDQGDGPGYSQEYLNDPFDNQDQYIRREDLIPMDADDNDRIEKSAVLFYAGADFAVSTSASADRTSFTIGCKGIGSRLCIIDQRDGRWSPDVWIDEMFLLQQRWNIDTWFVEDGVIWKALSPTIHQEMRRREVFLNLVPILPVKDKSVRGRAFQKRTRAGAIAFNTEATWFPEYSYEILRFTGREGATHDDRFDSTATLCLGLERAADLEASDFMSEEEIEFERNDPRYLIGRNAVTGY